ARRLVRGRLRADRGAVRRAGILGALTRPAGGGSVFGGEHPAVDVALVREQLLRAEPEVDLARRRLGAVGRMDEVLGGLQSEIAADRAGRGLPPTGRRVHAL